MSFKDQLKQDVATFINIDEFAETHSINNKSVECVLMLADKNTPLQYMDGTITSYKSIMIQSNLLEHGVPMPDDLLEIDGELFKVTASSEIEGIAFIDVSTPIGRFNRPIVIKEFTTVKVNGFPKQQWEDYHSCNAYIRHMNANDMLKIGTIVNNATIFVKIPYYEGITTKMRLEYKDKTYNITSIDNIEENNKFIDLICEVSE